MRRPVGQRSRRSATAGPGAKAGDRAGTRAHHTTSPTPLLSDAEVILSTTSWLASLGAWLAEEIVLAHGETVVLTRADAERMAEGLRRCVEGLDTVTVDVSQLPDPTPPPPDGTPSLSSPSPRTFQ